MMNNLSNGLDPGREATLATSPGLYRYAENFMMAFYDDASGIGMWLHLGTVPDDFGLWEDVVLLSLPGDGGLMWMTGYLRTPGDARPGASGLRFHCLEPFQRWRIEFDGMLCHSPYGEMLSGRVRDTRGQQVAFGFDTRALVPAWDNHQSVVQADGKGRGSMENQSWANEHYQQLYAIRGSLQLDGRTFDIDATGCRDHSRGQRGHATNAWGGHNLWTAVFPSGKAFGMQRMWNRDKQLNLNVGFVYVNGEFHHVDVVSEPDYLEHRQLRGEPVALVLRSPRGEHRISGETTILTLLNLEAPYGMSIGYDAKAGFATFAPGFARWQWDGETACGFCERSGGR